MKVSSVNAPVGGMIDVAHKVLVLSGDGDVVGEVNFSRFEGATVATVMGGFRAAERVAPRAKVFGQLLVGLWHDDAGTDFALQPGAGIDVPVNPRFDLRVRLDFPIDFFEGAHQTATRFGVGVVIPIGPK